MKKLIVWVVGLLLIGANAFAAGDLIVNGKLGVGTSSFTSAITTQTTDESVMELTATKSLNTFVRPAFLLNLNGNSTDAGGTGFVMNARANNVAATTGNLSGGSFNSLLKGSGVMGEVIGLTNYLILGTNAGSYNVNKITGNRVDLSLGAANNQNHTISSYYGFHSKGTITGSGNLSGTNWYHAYFEDFPAFSGTRTTVAGLWINKQTRGTNNYGIVLNGDGAGSDIVFGTTQLGRIYSASGRLYAQDSLGNQTILSPHDPETGEWIYYSKNIKTGKVVRVDMERLVKAVEKMTGETFMVESLMERN
ncbi:hypothetical protein C4544_03865 [candidate division WS5 bacterium]|uniref:Peptidase S74 domain-containing protein n=1 Tax=candidate division WS5 bacterium TaxID=2093353 RepID=A0A419DDA9_9BACT|nr:MAG: hypothetical protein C4544_03865 [candidate division WS5 bacterium]